MNRNILSLLFCFVFFSLFAQENPVQIVFDVTTDNKDTHKATIRHVKGMSNAYPDSKFEVVMYSNSLEMALDSTSTVKEDIFQLAQNNNVSFVVCEGTLKRHKIKKSKLIKGIETVPDGILQIIKRQQSGWGYIKEAHQ